jgi:hypothetical protein
LVDNPFQLRGVFNAAIDFPDWLPGPRRRSKVKLYMLCLLNWRTLLKHEKVQKLAIAYLAPQTPVNNNLGWYIGGGILTVPFSTGSRSMDYRVGVTHSRVIFEVYDPTADSLTSFDDFRLYREELEQTVRGLLTAGTYGFLSTPLGHEMFGLTPGRPVLLTYPLYQLAENGPLAKLLFDQKSVYSATQFPMTFNTTSLFTQSRDASTGDAVPIRISGASAVMLESSPEFVQKVMNTIYQAGLHKLVAKCQNLPKAPLVFDQGLDPLLEDQGRILGNDFVQLAYSESLEHLAMETANVNQHIALLNWEVVILTVALVVIDLLTLAAVTGHLP